MDRRRLLSLGVGAAAAGSLTGCAQPAGLTGLASPAPPASTARLGTLRKIAFGSCINQELPQPIWDAILADRPDLFIFGGDNVYASTQPWQLSTLERAYQRLAAQPGFARLRQSVPHLAIWDDHDFGLNDGGAGFPHKLASKQTFMDFWGLDATDPRRTREGIYHAQVFGEPGQRVQVILLDARTFRSNLRVTDQRNVPGKERYLPDPDPAKTILGEAQWRWLEAQLRESAEVRLIVSGVQVIVEGHGWEGWCNFPGEQARLIRLIDSTRAKGVVLLSGDRHIGAIYRHARAPAYPLYEMTSSGMTHAWAQAREVGPNRLGDLVTENHYGTVDIDWPTRQLGLTIRSVTGQPLRSQAIALADLA